MPSLQQLHQVKVVRLQMPSLQQLHRVKVVRLQNAESSTTSSSESSTISGTESSTTSSSTSEITSSKVTKPNHIESSKKEAPKTEGQTKTFRHHSK